ncbi:glycoside hydrolase family 6 protein [Nocardioides sp. Bht2]|uniref:glycoside hydrolase family 6 protein n=1 Tax=Nocardioides sp. Bht2 TaxID=3392297 RepID=UPI0039B4D0A7
MQSFSVPARLAGAVVVASALIAALIVSTGDPGAAPQAVRAAAEPRVEVWQEAEPAYSQNSDNPLAGLVWGVYNGPQDQASVAYQKAGAKQRADLEVIVRRPRTKWYGAFVPDAKIRASVQRYIAASQNGDPNKLVQLAVFRMKPWEHTACKRRSTMAERKSYRRWIRELAAGIGATPTLAVMQPDGPFLWCVPDRAVKARLLTYATRILSALPRTSVYIDAGAADWCENGKGNDPERCAEILKLTGIRYARGFAMDSTHYMGPAENIRHGSRIVEILERDGFGTKHFIVDTAKSGRPTRWNDMVPSIKGGLRDDARVCTAKVTDRCVTLGIPPTVRVADPAWGLAANVADLAARNVDGFVWFGRPWLYKQADPFVMKRARAMVRSTPWPTPLVDRR